MNTFQYTADGSPEAESRVREDLDRIVSTTLRHLPEESIDLIAVGGGFGRGEGGVIRNSEGTLHAFNDYDIVVLTTGRPDGDGLLAAAPGLAGEIGVDFVDFGILDRGALDRVAPTVFWYEFLAGHRVLHGPQDALAGIPRIDPATMDAIEATRLLINRGMGLLWAWLHLEDAGKNAKTYDGLRHRFTVNAMHKAVLSMGDAALIRSSRYHLSYRERARLIASPGVTLPPGFSEDFRSAHGAATRFKLHPEIPPADLPELRDRWHTIRSWHEAFFRWVEEERLGRSIGAWKNYPARAGREALARGARHPGRFIRERLPKSPLKGLSRFVLDSEMSCRAQLPFLLYGIDPDGLNAELAGSGLKGFGGGASRDALRWRSLTEELIGQWHP